MYKTFVFIFFLLAGVMSPVRAESGLLSSLLSLGFENISIGSTESSDWIIFEDRINRNISDGIEDGIRVIIESPDMLKEIDIILLKNHLPILKSSLSKDLIANYRKGLISFKDVLKGVIIVYNTDDYRHGLKKGREVALANYRLDKQDRSFFLFIIFSLT